MDLAEKLWKVSLAKSGIGSSKWSCDTGILHANKKNVCNDRNIYLLTYNEYKE